MGRVRKILSCFIIFMTLTTIFWQNAFAESDLIINTDISNNDRDAEKEIEDVEHCEDEHMSVLVNDSLNVCDVEIYGTARPGYTLISEYNLVGDCNPDSTIIRWYQSNFEDDEYTEIESGSKEYILKNAQGGKYIKASVTPVGFDDTYGSEVFSSAILVSEPLVPYAPNTENGHYYNLEAKSNNNYTFKENGYTYVFLEEEENGVYVIIDDSVGKVTMPSSPDNNYFNPENPLSIAYWLNNNYLSGEYGTSGIEINPHIIDYLLEREYLTEGNGISGAINQNDYIVKCKIALPAYHEYKQYEDRIGYQPVKYHGTSSSLMFIMRTPANTTYSIGYIRASNGSCSHCDPVKNNYGNYYIRPTMLIGYDYFKTYKIDVDSIGDEVKRMLRSRFTYDELAEVYTTDELIQLGYTGGIVSVNNFSVTGICAVGQLLNVECDVFSQNQSTEVKYSWYYSDAKDGVFRKIDGADSNGFVIQNRFENQYIKVEMIVFNSETDEKYSSYSYTTGCIEEEKGLTVVPSFDIEEEMGEKRAKYLITNNTDQDMTVYLVVAVFHENNIMINHTASMETIMPGTNEFYVEVDDNTATSYRIMAWDSFNSAEPLCGITVQ